jgi:hypothetical protein
MIDFGKRVSYAFRCFFSLLSNGEIPQDIAPEVVRTPAPSAVESEKTMTIAARSELQPEKSLKDSAEGAVQMLALLQRDGRLIDFFTEDITGYQDAQVGAAVRGLHQSCRQILEQYVKLEPIIASDEGQAVTIQPGFEPASIKLIGNVMGKPPLRGLLRHRGWRVTEVTLPPLPGEASRTVVAPAEVEIP